MAFCARQKPLKKIMRFLMLFFIGALGVGFSQTELDLKDLEKKPAGIVRDYYLWRYISDKKTSLKNAKKAYELTQNKITPYKKPCKKKA